MAQTVTSPQLTTEKVKEWRSARHLEYIDRAIIDTIAGRSPTVLLISLPPRHGKSELCAHWLPTWYLGMWPERCVIVASATSNLADEHGYKVRQSLSKHGPGLFDVTVKEDRRSISDWKTNKDGGLITAGVSGDIMGRDGHLLILDDYIKNDQKAMSETTRQQQWDWWQSTFTTRMEPGAVVIVIATRWHEQDLIGKILENSETGGGLPTRHIMFPAIATEGDELGRAPGDALWPERWPLGTPTDEVINDWGEKTTGLLMRKASMSPYRWNSLYQQRPTTHERAEFPEEWFGDEIWETHWPDAFEAGVIYIDPSKGTDVRRGDYSAIVFLGLSGGRMWIDSIVKRQPAYSIVSDAIALSQKYAPYVVGVEANMSQDLLLPMFEAQCKDRNIAPLPLEAIINKENKALRISRLGPHLSNSHFRFKNTASNRLLVSQIREFPLADHDDGPDALEGAVRTLSLMYHQHDPDQTEVITL